MCPGALTLTTHINRITELLFPRTLISTQKCSVHEGAATPCHLLKGGVAPGFKKEKRCFMPKCHWLKCD